MLTARDGRSITMREKVHPLASPRHTEAHDAVLPPQRYLT